MPREIWKKVPGFLEASSHGRIRSTDSYGNTRIKTTRTNDVGYKAITLVLTVHRLVSLAFKGVSTDLTKQHVRHLNGNGLDNRPSNLKWGSAKENCADRKKHGRQSFGETHVNAVISEKVAIKIVNLLQTTKLSLVRIANKFNVSVSLVRNIYDKRSWRHLYFDRRKAYERKFRLSKKEVRSVRKMYKRGVRIFEISKKLDVPWSTIADALRRKDVL